MSAGKPKSLTIILAAALLLVASCDKPTSAPASQTGKKCPALVRLSKSALRELRATLDKLDKEIAVAKKARSQLAGGLVLRLIDTRLETLRLTRALLRQRIHASEAGVALTYTFASKRHPVPPPDSTLRDGLEAEIKNTKAQIVAAELEASKYAGGLVLALIHTRLETARVTLAFLQLRALANRYGIPLGDISTLAPASALRPKSPTKRPEAPLPLPEPKSEKLAPEKLAALKLALRKRLIGLPLTYDKVEDQITIVDNSPEEAIAVVIVIEGKKLLPPILQLRYKGENWIFARRIVIRAGAKKYEWDKIPFQRDTLGGGKVSERAAVPIIGPVRDALFALAKVGGGTLRLDGSKANHDIQISAATAKTLAAMVDLQHKLRLAVDNSVTLDALLPARTLLSKLGDCQSLFKCAKSNKKTDKPQLEFVTHCLSLSTKTPDEYYKLSDTLCPMPGAK
ncbi:MAG: hypothetical protein KC609_07000, partial [Myxococcales bacterium]|nr:hypothetical protein [Myxococcales bacterium]